MMRVYFLEVKRSDTTTQYWGPFDSEYLAWRRLLGRPWTEEERQPYLDAGWKVRVEPADQYKYK